MYKYIHDVAGLAMHFVEFIHVLLSGFIPTSEEEQTINDVVLYCIDDIFHLIFRGYEIEDEEAKVR